MIEKNDLFISFIKLTEHFTALHSVSWKETDFSLLEFTDDTAVPAKASILIPFDRKLFFDVADISVPLDQENDSALPAEV